MSSVDRPGVPAPASRVLWFSTAAFTLLFAVWLMLGILGVRIQKEFNLTPGQFEWLIAVSILAGALPRLHFGILAEKYGGKRVMILTLLFTALPTWLLARAESYEGLLICAGLFGLAGNSFTVGVAWISAWYPQSEKGTALGIFGAGNVGASVTKFLAPTLFAIGPVLGLGDDWRIIPQIYSILLVIMAGILWLGTPSPDRCPGKGRSMVELLEPLKHVRVWRFGLYYVVVFGAYVALAAWLPRYYVEVYDIPLSTAGYLTALFIFPASLLRPLGGWLSDCYGPRLVSYCVFITMTATLLLLSVPGSILSIGAGTFTFLIVVVGAAMGIGKAAVFKYIPSYFPSDVGAVGGLVGMLGALGGFALPPLFGTLSRWGDCPQLAFLSLLILSVVSLVWLHLVVIRQRKLELTTADLSGDQGDFSQMPNMLPGSP